MAISTMAMPRIVRSTMTIPTWRFGWMGARRLASPTGCQLKPLPTKGCRRPVVAIHAITNSPAASRSPAINTVASGQCVSASMASQAVASQRVDQSGRGERHRFDW